MATWRLKVEPPPSGETTPSPGHLAALFSTICSVCFLFLSLRQRAKGSDALPGQPCEGQPPERARWPAV